MNCNMLGSIGSDTLIEFKLNGNILCIKINNNTPNLKSTEMKYIGRNKETGASDFYGADDIKVSSIISKESFISDISKSDIPDWDKTELMDFFR